MIFLLIFICCFIWYLCKYLPSKEKASQNKSSLEQDLLAIINGEEIPPLEEETSSEENSNTTINVKLKDNNVDTSRIVSYTGTGIRKFEFRPQTWEQFIAQDEAKKQAQTITKKIKRGIRGHFILGGLKGCFVAGTKILMQDYSWKNIEDIKIGETILGFEEKGQKFLQPSVVLNTMIRETDELVYIKSDKNEVWTTPEHPFLTLRKYGTCDNSYWNTASRLTAQHRLYNFNIYDRNTDWQRGWLLGFICADGSMPCKSKENQNIHFYNKNRKIIAFIAKSLKKLYGIRPSIVHKENKKYQITISSRTVRRLYDRFENLFLNQQYASMPKEFWRGTVAGFYDGDGTPEKNQGAMFCNINLLYIQSLEKIQLSFNFRTYIKTRKVNLTRLIFEKYHSKKEFIYNLYCYDFIKFFTTFQPISKYNRKFNLKITENQSIWLKKIFQTIDRQKGRGFKKERLQSRVYNLTTSTDTYIANGFPVHNCGKTTFVELFAKDIKAKLLSYVGRQVNEDNIPDIVNAINSSTEQNVVLFIDEIDCCEWKVLKILNPIIEQFKINDKLIKPFVFASATISRHLLVKNNPDLLDRIPHSINFVRYTIEDLATILNQYKNQLYTADNITMETINTISNSCKYTPRIAISLLEDYVVEQDIQAVLKNRNIVIDGLDVNDIKVLEKLSVAKRAIGSNSLALQIGLNEHQYLCEVEPYLLEFGYIQRVPSRVITPKGLEILRQIRGIK